MKPSPKTKLNKRCAERQIDVENKEKDAAVATSEDEVEKHKVVELDED